MSTSIRLELRSATEAAWKAARTETAGNGGGPRPGDVFVIPETSHLAVEWAVIEEDPASGGLYAVPADTWDQVGSHDVHVEAGRACGPLSLRCGLGLWLPPERFDPELRSGVLESADLESARRVRQAVECGAVEATEAQRETDTELEYREWIDNGPGQARGLLDRAWRLGIPPGPPFAKGGKDSSLALRPLERRGGHPPRRLLALAASLLLATTLAGGLIWRQRTENREPGKATVETQIVTLVRTRGVREISITSNVEALELRIGDSYPEPYRVEVLSEDPPRTIHTSESLTLVLPVRALPAGEYRVLVLRGGGTERIGDYKIEIEYRDNEHRP